MKMISSNKLKSLRVYYQAGTRVKLVRMEDPYTNLKPGDKGTVNMVDDIGSVFVNWDCGSSLSVVYGEDAITKIEE